MYWKQYLQIASLQIADFVSACCGGQRPEQFWNAAYRCVGGIQVEIVSGKLETEKLFVPMELKQCRLLWDSGHSQSLG
ncbi:hypothetical protein SS50377_26884 [Spironucleus salmonicida]|uniref:Uncharacterized protein n=1 Tax=Spironucleus salmonicida TaxID=348837 RepID=V6LS44_9EUKA|nr:hypothetical protein SS50377_26884 [Spironucleus salmonicida]|eukprot:EST47395.1 Hypothetical protein SS50377_12382 [Spironucleus salmonicida]